MELNRWPKCVKCQGPVEYYYLQHKLDTKTVVVHAMCHGKKDAQELGAVSAEWMATPLEMFGER